MNEEIEELGRDESEPLLGKLSKFANSDNPECSGAVSISDLRDLSGLLLEDDGVGWDVEELEGKFREWGEYFGYFFFFFDFCCVMFFFSSYFILSVDHSFKWIRSPTEPPNFLGTNFSNLSF